MCVCVCGGGGGGVRTIGRGGQVEFLAVVEASKVIGSIK